MANPVPSAEPNPALTGAGAPRAPFNFKIILQQMVQRNASDLHLKVGRPPTLRIDGHMVSLELPALKQEDLRSLAEQIMAPKNIKEFSEQKESDFALAVPGIGRFRVNAYQQRGTTNMLELARSGYLASIYAHLMSLGNVSRLSERLDALMDSKSD